MIKSIFIGKVECQLNNIHSIDMTLFTAMKYIEIKILLKTAH